MPRDIPVGNGRLLVTFDDRYQIRDLYFPHVGQENHAGASPCRFGVLAKTDAHPEGRVAWTCEPGWAIEQRYLRDTLTTSVRLEHAGLGVDADCNDAVDFHRPVLVRRIRLKNRLDQNRPVRLFTQQYFNMSGATPRTVTRRATPRARSTARWPCTSTCRRMARRRRTSCSSPARAATSSSRSTSGCTRSPRRA